jgi:hypothetical protein
MMGFEAGMMAPGGFGSAWLWLWLGRKNPKQPSISPLN